MTSRSTHRPDETDAEQFYNGPTDAVFDLALLRQAYDHVLGLIEPMTTERNGEPLRCISLTHRPGAEDLLADGLVSQFTPNGTMRYHEREFSCFNPMFSDTYFAVVHQAVSALMPIGRMRLMILAPGTVHRMHADATKRAHLAIHTDPNAYLVGPDGHGHHIPADGRLRVFDTRAQHTVFNAGTTDRVHLLMSIADTERLHHSVLLTCGWPR
ncbi:aspartyl/asparaginyl beta-hydroxylase domain-containing protein [Nocardia puris]|uniref:Aspartyl/asparaginyl beta-hydroxylase n=1 Tax=Nocardia puris TaxID=208602 RepID=A0A366D8V2_9NOCA|nr:aspartyl/asparaginyl beta-hydroxylase domain-containing protein [Nocardia puris]RBO86463.1 aspartyl/asparaginyl beta-hydroxylase [Nocardia puris]